MAGRPGLSSVPSRSWARWSSAATATRRRLRRVPWGRVAGLGAVAVVAALVLGVTTASVEQSLGPHVARYDVTTDGLVTVDLGPLGTVELESPLPLTLGAHVRVEEIPAEVTAVDPAQTVQVLSRDLQGYVQFFTGPRATIEDVARALVLDAARRAALLLLGVVVLAVAVRALLGPARRAELDAVAGRHRRAVRSAVAIGTVVTVTCVSSSAVGEPSEVGRPASAVFAGTALEGARLTGRLAGVIDTYGGRVVDAYRANERFYAGVQTAVAAAWDERAEAVAARERAEAVQARDAERAQEAARASVDGDEPGAGADPPDPAPSPSPDGLVPGADVPGPDAPADAAADDAPDAGSPTLAPGAPGTSGDPAGGVEPAAEDGDGGDADGDEDGDRAEDGDRPDEDDGEDAVEPVVLLLVTDLHCNVGMARVIRTVAERAGADVVLNAGDTTVNGTSVERYCITAFSRAVPDGVARVVADGNHDSPETGAQERRSGWTVLDGDVVTVAGVRVLGDRDPNQTQIGAGTSQLTEETPAELGERLAETACDAPDGVDVLLVHNPRVGEAALRSGCVPVQLSGHFHRRIGPEPVGSGIRYVGSSTAGAIQGSPTVGPLNGVAELTVLRFDPRTRRMLDLQLVSVSPDGSAAVGDRTPFPVAIPEPPTLGPTATQTPSAAPATQTPSATPPD